MCNMAEYPISERVIRDLERVESGLVEAVSSPGEALSNVALATLCAGGKRLRPALVLICGQAADYDLSRLLPAAVSVELVHMASLIHDDVLDGAGIRRGSPTVYAAYGARTASAVGDFLFAKAFEILAELADERALVALSEATVALCLGEFEQMQTAHFPHQSIETYLRKIGHKTAALFAASCRLGGIMGGARDEDVERLGAYGFNLGLAFQIYDDILDLIGGASLGKPIGTDLRDGTVTMPMLYAIDEVEERDVLVSVIEAETPDEAKVLEAIEIVRKSRAMDKAKAQARAFIDEAVRIASGLGDRAVSDQLAAIGEYVINRYN